jgi:hypothetical protein
VYFYPSHLYDTAVIIFSNIKYYRGECSAHIVQEELRGMAVNQSISSTSGWPRLGVSYSYRGGLDFSGPKIRRSTVDTGLRYRIPSPTMTSGRPSEFCLRRSLTNVVLDAVHVLYWYCTDGRPSAKPAPYRGVRMHTAFALGVLGGVGVVGPALVTAFDEVGYTCAASVSQNNPV